MLSLNYPQYPLLSGAQNMIKWVVTVSIQLMTDFVTSRGPGQYRF